MLVFFFSNKEYASLIVVAPKYFPFLLVPFLFFIESVPTSLSRESVRKLSPTGKDLNDCSQNLPKDGI